MNAQDEVQILDTTLRDGSYIVDFQFTAEDTALIASALESAGIRLIEIGHGLGLGAARAGKGEQAASDRAYLRAAASVLREAWFGTFFIPGVGTADDVRMAADEGMRFIRVGTNITEVDHAEPYVALAKELGLFVSCNFMKSYAVAASKFAHYARMAEGFGADVVCLVDSAGGMLPEEVAAYVRAAKEATQTVIGFHGHDNLCLAMANALAAYEAGSTILDASLQGLGRSEGNAVTEVLAIVLQKRGLLPEIDVDVLLDTGEAFVRPLMHEPKYSAIGITSGRARFHSSFLGRVIAASARRGIEARQLILRLGSRNQVDVPQELIDAVADEIAGQMPRPRPRVALAPSPEGASAGFLEEMLGRARELKEKSSKSGLPSVLNIVVTTYEKTHVSPYVECGYGCALSNVMLAEASLLQSTLETADGWVDYVLLDAGGEPPPADALRHSTLLTYSDHEMWARAAVVHLAKLLPAGLSRSTIALTGVAPLALRAAISASEAGARVLVDAALAQEAQGLARFAGRVEFLNWADAVRAADAVVSLSPRRPAVSAAHVRQMHPEALLYDGGIGSLEPEAVAAAEACGIRVVRIDLRPSLAATALELIGIRRIVSEHMGRETWDGVEVVAGGLIGRRGEAIVDSIRRPTRVIGVADGCGGIEPVKADDERVQRVRRVIAERLLGQGGRQA